MELVLWLSLCAYHGATKLVTGLNVVHGLPVTVYELVLCMAFNFCNGLLECGYGLPVTVYMS